MSWWQYLLLVNLYLILFYGFYALLLRRETFFQLNRIYLVSAAIFSFFIPLIQAGWVQNLFITQKVEYTLYNGNALIIHGFKPIEEAPVNMGQLLGWIYLAGVSFLALRLFWQLILLNKIISNHDYGTAWSFFKRIRLGENGSDTHIINAHEQVHAKQWHSADVLITEAVMIINWFNPVVYFYRRAIKQIHEFIADSHAVKTVNSKTDYALLLMSQTFDIPQHQLLNHFFNSSLLKQRIIMLQKNKSQRIALLKYGLSAPLFVLMLILSSATVNNSTAVKIINTKAEQLFTTPASTLSLSKITASVANSNGAPAINPQIIPPSTKTGNQRKKDTVIVLSDSVIKKNNDNASVKALLTKLPGVHIDSTGSSIMAQGQKVTTVRVNGKDHDPHNIIFSAVEQEPQFIGGQAALMKFLAANIKYPAAMREHNIQGRVYISFIIETDGSLSDVKALRGPGYGAEEEAVRVIKLTSSKWIAGMQNGRYVRVQYTIPVAFSLDGSQPENITLLPSAPDTGKKITTGIYLGHGIGVEPLYILDGKKITSSEFKNIQPNDITSISILKDQSATVLYGKDGANGVVVITLKKKK